MRQGASLFIAGRSFWGRKGRGGGAGRGRNYLQGAVIGIALSIVPLTVVLFVADGMIEGITSRYLETSTCHLQALPWYSRDSGEMEAAAARIAKVEGVRAAYPEFQGPAIVLGTAGEDSVSSAATNGAAVSATYGAVVRAVEPDFLADPGLRTYLHPLAGELAFKRDNDVLLGASLARKIGAKPGDIVSFLTAREGESGSASMGMNPRLTNLRVRAIVSTGYEELDALWAFVPMATGSRMLAPGTRRAIVGIKVDDPWKDLEPIRAAIQAAAVSGDSQDWNVSTWGEIERNLWKSFATTRALLSLVMALAVAVAAVNVGSALVMLALERRRDIAILKSAGASQGQVATIFVSLGAMTGLSGVAAGLMIGCLVSLFINEILGGIEKALNFLLGIFRGFHGQAGELKLLNPAYYLERIPVRIEIPRLVLIALLGIGLSVLASLIPARKAALEAPLETFRRG